MKRHNPATSQRTLTESKDTDATGWGAASALEAGVMDHKVRDDLVSFYRLNTDEARAVFADHWLNNAASALESMKEKEYYRDPKYVERKKPYESFEEYFGDVMGQSLAVWAELEATSRSA